MGDAGGAQSGTGRSVAGLVGLDGSALTVAEATANPAGVLYGGGPVAASILLAERHLGARVRWSTTRFLAGARVGDVIDLALAVDVQGRSSAHATVVGRSGSGVVFETWLVTGRDRTDGAAGRWVEMPDAPAPEDVDASVPVADVAGTAIGTIERRPAYGRFPEDGLVDPAARLGMWMRVPGLDSADHAVLGWLADCVPLALALGMGQRPGGTSLDNTMRFTGAAGDEGGPDGDDWILVDIRADAAGDGYGHGRADLWSRAGLLLATGTQTAIIRPNP